MKTTKRIFAMLLCVLMVCAMSITAFADETTPHTITITNPEGSAAGYTYQAYQVFVGDLSGETLSNITWGTGVNGDALLAELQGTTAFADCENVADVAGVLAGAGDNSETAKAFAAAVANNLTDTYATSAAGADANTYTISVTGDGYYFIKNPNVPDVDNTTFTNYILKVVGDVSVAHKGTYPTVEKKIIDNSVAVDANEAFIGETVNYQLTGSLPTNIGDYNTYYYKFTDTLSTGLTYDEVNSITVNGVDVTDYFYVKHDNGALTIGITDLLALEKVTGVGDITANTKVIVNFDATLNENAVIAGTGNTNKVELTYSNDPNNSGTGATEAPEKPADDTETPAPENPTGDTPEDTVVTYTTQLTINKTNGSTALTGASFELDGPGFDNVVLPKTGDPATSVFTFTGLGAGTYTITEVVTPDGYNTIAPITFTVEYKDGAFTIKEANTGIEVKDNKLETTIKNVAGSQLPSTGGIGTTVFYLVGGLLAMAAAVMLIAKRRAGAAC